MTDTSVIAIDIAKSSFEVCVGTTRGRIKERVTLRRSELLNFMRNRDACLVLMEACGGASYWGREFKQLEHQVKLIAPQFVKPYVKSNKNDRADAEAILEAGLRPTMRYVAVKTDEQQDIQSLHRVRQRLLKQRTALSNEIRGLLMEYGVVLPKGISHVRSRLWEVIEKNRWRLTEMIVELVGELSEEFNQADTRISKLDKKLERLAGSHPVCKRLMAVPGIGPLIATAVVSYVGNPQQFKNGRAMAAYLGLVPKQYSTGGKPKLGGISKRGDKYIRQLLVHGARSALFAAKSKTDRISQWVRQLHERRGFNKACVALANKNARILWALMAKDQEYRA